jgi:hypothetical protein
MDPQNPSQHPEAAAAVGDGAVWDGSVWVLILGDNGNVLY